MGMTPNQYRQSRGAVAHIADSRSILGDISDSLIAGNVKAVSELLEKAISEGISASSALDALLLGMSAVGERFKNNEVYVPEVLIAARAMNTGVRLLKPYLISDGVEPLGRVCIGTVRGDLHDIGKNLVKMMLEGKGFEVIDLGTDVSADEFIRAAIEMKCRLICCSALLTTTVGVMGEVVQKAIEAGIRDKVGILIGGAPVSEELCISIGADAYTSAAASAAETAVSIYKSLESVWKEEC